MPEVHVSNLLIVTGLLSIVIFPAASLGRLSRGERRVAEN